MNCVMKEIHHYLVIAGLGALLLLAGCGTKQASKDAPNMSPPPPVSIEERNPAQAKVEYTRGLTLLKQGKNQEARKALLLALYHDPSHKHAARSLGNISARPATTYVVKQGDTLGHIAKLHYDDTQAYPYIIGANKLESEALQIGQKLAIPIFDQKTGIGVSAPPPAAPRQETLLEKGHRLFEQGRYTQAAVCAKQLLTHDKNNRDAQMLHTSSLYQLAAQAVAQGDLEQAVTLYSETDPDYKDTEKRLADVHYKLGVKLYTEEDFDRAINEWQHTLKLAPKHPHAHRDLENVRDLKSKLEKVE